MTGFENHEGLAELIEHYNSWRKIYARMGTPARNEPDWEEGRLWLRDGYPHPDWSAFVVQREANGYKVFRASTERRIDPVLSYQGFFSRLEDAGKFIIAAIGDYLRIDRRLDPISWTWQDAGHNPAVEELVTSAREVTYRLRDNPNAYCIMALGDRPYSYILPLSYTELNSVLLQGFPESSTSDSR